MKEAENERIHPFDLQGFLLLLFFPSSSTDLRCLQNSNRINRRHGHQIKYYSRWLCNIRNVCMHLFFYSFTVASHSTIWIINFIANFESIELQQTKSTNSKNFLFCLFFGFFIFFFLFLFMFFFFASHICEFASFLVWMHSSVFCSLRMAFQLCCYLLFQSVYFAC